jgi:hypothetical protein
VVAPLYPTAWSAGLVLGEPHLRQHESRTSDACGADLRMEPAARACFGIQSGLAAPKTAEFQLKFVNID